MKRIFVAMALYLLLVSGVEAQVANGIHFEQGLSWAQVKEKANKENKWIFIDCFASWCGPCKAMDKEVYPSEKVGNFMNENFISIKIQMDTDRQDNDQIKKSYGEAHRILQAYKINAFPTFLFFAPDGHIVNRGIGYQSEEGLIAISKDAMDPDKQYYTLLERFDHGSLDTAYMKRLAYAASTMGDKELAGMIANDYINRLPECDIYTADNIRFIGEFTRTSSDRGFTIFRDHAVRIHQAVNEISVEDAKGLAENIIYKEEMKPYLNSKNGDPDWGKMESNVKKYDSFGEQAYRLYKPIIVFRLAIEPALKKDPDWTKILPVIKRQHAGKGEEFLVGSSVVYYLNNGLMSGVSNDCSNFMAAATYYFKNYYSYLTADPLNTWAWTVFERSSDKKELARALVWSDICLKLSPNVNAGYLDTYANLLYKLGKSFEAIAWEKKAVELAPGDEAIQDNFLKMKKGENTWKNSE